jgi:hypothetical protein
MCGLTPSFTGEKLRAQAPSDCMTQLWGWCHVEGIVNSPTTLGAASFILAQSVGDSQWASGFLIKGIWSFIVVESVSPGGGLLIPSFG